MPVEDLECPQFDGWARTDDVRLGERIWGTTSRSGGVTFATICADGEAPFLIAVGTEKSTKTSFAGINMRDVLITYDIGEMRLVHFSESSSWHYHKEDTDA